MRTVCQRDKLWGSNRSPFYFQVHTKAPEDGVESVRLFNPPEEFVVKQPVIREVKSLYMSCDRIGNLLLAKFAYQGAKDSCVFIPASIVFWLLEHMPVNQDPALRAPPVLPQIFQEDWDDMATPRVLSVQCKQFQDAIRMTMELDRKPNLTVLLDRSNIELMRQMMMSYSKDLINLDAA
jgi:hypothetical protein